MLVSPRREEQAESRLTARWSSRPLLTALPLARDVFIGSVRMDPDGDSSQTVHAGYRRVGSRRATLRRQRRRHGSSPNRSRSRHLPRASSATAADPGRDP